MGQRTTIVTILTIVLMVVAVLLGGHAGSFPALAAESTTVTPDYLVNLVGQIIAPLTLLLAMLSKLFTAISSRVTEGTIQPGNLLQLLSLPEFWTAVVGAVVGIGEIFGVHLLTPDQQVVVVNALLGLFTVFLDSLGKRASQAYLPTEMIVDGKAITVQKPLNAQVVPK